MAGSAEIVLGPDELADLAIGCAVLGAGGGGDPRTGLLMALQAIDEHGPVRLVSYDDLPGDGIVMPCGGVGAPTVSIEKLGNSDEGRRLRNRVEHLLDRPVVALMSAEIGGTNGLLPTAWASTLGLPVLDADGMGRAFPEMQQVSMHVAGISPNPCVLTDERGNTLVVETIGGRWVERVVRALAVELGARASVAVYVLTVEQARTATVSGTVTLARRIGALLRAAEADPVAELVNELAGFRLVRGKIVDVERRTTGGFARGSALVEGLGADAGRTLRLEIQNENLVALEEGRVLASVPDIITVLDDESGTAVTTERLRYGQRVSVIALPCHPIWRSDRGLAVAGPRMFGYDFDYQAVEELHATAA
ncbi:MAG TPA: DUF917 domain-containing protein [Gaiellaceae bacterium]|nr:DUF917 domain-containing protein [Gaiellaceae bacterium]